MVKGFFAKCEVAGLLLPDGWFGGRPMENQHRLTFVAQRPKRLLVELDDQILLSFSGGAVVTETTSQHALLGGTPTLVVSGFRQCVVEYLQYGSDAPDTASYRAGQVQFVAPT
jgi:hypothetical protein